MNKKIYITLLKSAMFLSIFITMTIIIFIIIYITINGINYVNLKFVLTAPSYMSNHIGILPDILNTIYIIFTTILILVPIAVGAAIYLTEYCKIKNLVYIIEYSVEILSFIPSIIYGLVGMLLFCQFFKLKTSLLAGALTLVIMNTPTIMRTTEESLKTIEQNLKEGAFALGAGKWRVIKTIIIPNCIEGIVTGVILSIGRIVGETATLLFTAGLAHKLNGYFMSLTNSSSTLSVALYIYAKEQGEFNVSFAIAFILIILVFVINLMAHSVSYLFKRKNN